MRSEKRARPKRRTARSSPEPVVFPGADGGVSLRLDPIESRKPDIDPVVANMTRPREAVRSGTPLSVLHRAVATPIARLFAVLGFAPGQLSLQSLTVTVVAMATAADGTWLHLLTAGGLVWLGLLLDRVDGVLAERKGAPGPWSLFLGSTIDRLVELAIVAGLGVLAARNVTPPWGAWLTIPEPWLPVILVGTGGLWMARRAIEQSAETLLLRQHLLSTRRLPGPMALARRGVVHPWFGAIIGRDETVVMCAVGIALGQVAVTTIALGAIQLLGLLEAIVLFHMRMREPEPEASRVLGPSYP